MRQDWKNKALSIILSYNFIKADDFSINEIKETLGIENKQLKENDKTDYIKYMKAQNILVKLAKEYEKRLRDFIEGKNKIFNKTFNIDDIKFEIYDKKLNNNELSYTADPKNQKVIIFTDLYKLFNSDSFSACLHEVIHCLNYDDLKDKNSINKFANSSGIEYFTSPLEYNAITNELFLKAINIICNYAKMNGTEPEILVKDKKLLAKILSKMLTDICTYDNTYKDFLTCQPENKLRHIFNRLYGFVERALKENCIEFLEKLTDLRLQILFESILTTENK
nr:MAG TPA: hypothetical protein [Caudoviricetes sp.]